MACSQISWTTSSASTPTATPTRSLSSPLRQTRSCSRRRSAPIGAATTARSPLPSNTRPATACGRSRGAAATAWASPASSPSAANASTRSSGRSERSQAGQERPDRRAAGGARGAGRGEAGAPALRPCARGAAGARHDPRGHEDAEPVWLELREVGREARGEREVEHGLECTLHRFSTARDEPFSCAGSVNLRPGNCGGCGRAAAR